MKKEAFVKTVDAILAAQERHEKLCERLNEALRSTRNVLDTPNFSDLVYDYGIEDDLIDMFELEFGPDGRDKIAAYIYEQKGLGIKTSYKEYADAGELYDDIISSKQK